MRIVAIAATIDHMSNQRRRAITQQMHGEPVQFAEVRIIEIADAAERVTVAGEVEGPFTVIFEGGGEDDQPRLVLVVRRSGVEGDDRRQARLCADPPDPQRL